LLTHTQTDKQTKSGKNITSLAEVNIRFQHTCQCETCSQSQQRYYATVWTFRLPMSRP